MDAAELEVMRQALTAIPEEMGVVLVRSSYSPNIKERGCLLRPLRRAW